MTERSELQGRAGVVTGGGRGIGAGVVALLAASGARVVSVDRDHGTAPAGEVRTVVGSVTQREDVAAAIERCREEYGRIDFLVANAGVVTSTPFLELTDAEWDHVLGVNLTGAFLCVQEAARAMAREGHPGSIVVMSSINAWWAEPNMAHYNSSKAGAIGLVRSAARELAPRGIRVNAVCPGMVQTPLTAPTTIDSPHAAAYLASIPAGRYGLPDDVARAVRFLVADDSEYITGTTITVDGGQTIGTDFRMPPTAVEP